jgi:hypothetical protein
MLVPSSLCKKIR